MNDLLSIHTNMVCGGNDEHKDDDDQDVQAVAVGFGLPSTRTKPYYPKD